MVILQWDYVVQFVNQLEVVIEIFVGQQLWVVVGGWYLGWGICNVLSYFGLMYIEFFVIVDLDELCVVMDKFFFLCDVVWLLLENEVLFWVVLCSDDIDVIYDQLCCIGVIVLLIVDGQCNDLQGNIICWWIFIIDGDIVGLVYFFVLQWEEDDVIWLMWLCVQRLDVLYLLGDIMFEQVVFEVVNLQVVCDCWQVLLGFLLLGEQGLDVGGQ